MVGARSKIIAGLTLAVALAIGGAAQAQVQSQPEKPPIVARAEECLRQKVDRVVADEPDIAAAANFLVDYACADEVAGATRYLRNETYVQLFGAIAKVAATASANKPAGQAQGQPQAAGASAAAAASAASAVASRLKVDPETGEMRMSAPGPQAAQVNGMLSQSSSILSQFLPDNIPVSIRKLAGDLVLEARERHRAK